jgi:hypothetical protein
MKYKLSLAPHPEAFFQSRLEDLEHTYRYASSPAAAATTSRVCGEENGNSQHNKKKVEKVLLICVVQRVKGEKRSRQRKSEREILVKNEARAKLPKGGGVGCVV